MKKLINFIKNYREKRLRERCVKYASRRTTLQSSIATDAHDIYIFIKRG